MSTTEGIEEENFPFIFLRAFAIEGMHQFRETYRSLTEKLFRNGAND